MNLPEILQQHRRWLETDGREGRRAHLRDANLSGADLRGANLSGAELTNALLAYADLCGADLRAADLADADLTDANLARTNLNGADLSRADLRGAVGFPVVADARQRLVAVARAALADDSALAMDTWHTCQTTHCVAGWAIHQAGKPGRLLEEAHGPEIAGRMLLGHEAAMHFRDDDDDARAWLQSVLDAADGEVVPEVPHG